MKNEFYNASYEILNQKAQSIPSKIAFVDDRNSINYKDLKQKVESFSTSLISKGLKQEDKIIICMHDCINYAVSFLGAIWGGVVPICINTMLPKKDLSYMLKDSEAKAIICSPELLETFYELKHENHKEILLFSELTSNNFKDDKNVFNISDMLIEKTLKETVARTERKTPCFWLYSSGSTGNPKGTVHMHESLLNTADLYAKNILNINENDIFFSAAKLFFAYGLGNALTFPLSVGGTSILTKERPTVELVTNIVKKNKVTLFFGVPTLYAAMLNSDLKPDKR